MQIEEEISEETCLVIDYLSQLNDKEKVVYQIAKEHLKTSFHIVKSNGFVEWKKKQLAAAAASSHTHHHA